MTIDEAGDNLIDMIVRTANGRNTEAEALGHKNFQWLNYTEAHNWWEGFMDNFDKG